MIQAWSSTAPTFFNQQPDNPIRVKDKVGARRVLAANDGEKRICVSSATYAAAVSSATAPRSAAAQAGP